MSFKEKKTWAFLVIAIAGYASYLAIVFSRADGHPLVDVDYVPVLLWTVGSAIVVGIVTNIVISVTSRTRDAQDQRDKEINRFGEYVGQSFVVIGGVSALFLAMVEANYFWIANALYLGFVLSAVLSSIAKLASYRLGFQPW